MWSQALARAPAGRIPEATKVRGQAARAAGEIQLGADIANASDALLQLLLQVHRIKLLLDPMVVENAVRRYETCWLPQVAQHAATRARSILAPPLDVAWIWLLHALDPVAYARDLQAIMSNSVMRWWPDQMVPMHRPRHAIIDARAGWEAMHLYEPYDITHSLASKYDAMQTYLWKLGHVSKLSVDFQAASASMAAFIYQVSLPHYQEPWFLERAAARYRRFLHLHRLHGSTTLIPPPDVDLCWRAHQLFHVAYCSDTMALFGAIWLRDDLQLAWKPGQLDFNFQLTKELYQAAFEETLIADGTMFRGSVPTNWARTPVQSRSYGVPCDQAHGAVTTPGGLAAWGFDLVEVPPDTVIPDCWPELPEDGVLLVCTTTRGGPQWQQMTLLMHHRGSSFEEASVLVLDPHGAMLARAQLVGSDQLLVRAPGHVSHDYQSPGLTGAAGERAFTVSTDEHDWGVMVAVNRPGDTRRALVGDDKKDIKAGGMHVRLCQIDSLGQPAPSSRWIRNELPGKGTLWELLYGGVKSKLIGKSTRLDHPRDVSILLGKQGTPLHVVCGQKQDPAVALAMAGVLALQRTILFLQEHGGLLRVYTGSTGVAEPQHKLLDENETFAAARARLAFPQHSLSTPQRPMPKVGSAASAPLSSGTKPALITAAQRERLAAERQEQEEQQCLSSASLSSKDSDAQMRLKNAKPRPIAEPLLSPPTPQRSIQASRASSMLRMTSSDHASCDDATSRVCNPQPSRSAASQRRANSSDWGQYGIPAVAIQLLGSDAEVVQQFLGAIRTGASDEVLQFRRDSLLAEAAPNLRPDLLADIPMSPASSRLSAESHGSSRCPLTRTASVSGRCVDPLSFMQGSLPVSPTLESSAADTSGHSPQHVVRRLPYTPANAAVAPVEPDSRGEVPEAHDPTTIPLRHEGRSHLAPYQLDTTRLRPRSLHGIPTATATEPNTASDTSAPSQLQSLSMQAAADVDMAATQAALETGRSKDSSHHSTTSELSTARGYPKGSEPHCNRGIAAAANVDVHDSVASGGIYNAANAHRIKPSIRSSSSIVHRVSLGSSHGAGSSSGVTVNSAASHVTCQSAGHPTTDQPGSHHMAEPAGQLTSSLPTSLLVESSGSRKGDASATHRRTTSRRQHRPELKSQEETRRAKAATMYVAASDAPKTEIQNGVTVDALASATPVRLQDGDNNTLKVAYRKASSKDARVPPLALPLEAMQELQVKAESASMPGSQCSLTSASQDVFSKAPARLNEIGNMQAAVSPAKPQHDDMPNLASRLEQAASAQPTIEAEGRQPSAGSRHKMKKQGAQHQSSWILDPEFTIEAVGISKGGTEDAAPAVEPKTVMTLDALRAQFSQPA